MVLLGLSSVEGGKITLDRGTFKVLASETRIGILKKLDEKQMTVSDLSRALGMNKATLFEHLEKMIEAGLIKKKEDERKWVYYTLTWKGKNILHPERTKIAIVLGITILGSIVLIYLIAYMLSSGVLIPSTMKTDVDAPTIEFTGIKDITEKTTIPVDFVIKVQDDKSINESSLKIEYTFSDTYVYDLGSLNGWQEFQASITQGEVLIRFTSINWSNYSGRYLYIKCSISDMVGNSAQNILVEYIEKVYDGSQDLSISVSDVSILKDIDSIPPKGNQEIPIKIKIHNTGSTDAFNTEISIFNDNPDSDGDGIVDTLTSIIRNRNVDFIESGNITSIELNINLNLSQSKEFWVVVDPSNEFDEIDERNNIVNIKLHSFLSKSIIPEFPPPIGILGAVLIILFYSVSRKKHKQNRK